jgi:hypothetical protein
VPPLTIVEDTRNAEILRGLECGLTLEIVHSASRIREATLRQRKEEAGMENIENKI